MHLRELEEGWTANSHTSPSDKSIIQFKDNEGKEFNIPFGVLTDFLSQVVALEQITKIEEMTKEELLNL